MDEWELASLKTEDSEEEETSPGTPSFGATPSPGTPPSTPAPDEKKESDWGSPISAQKVKVNYVREFEREPGELEIFKGLAGQAAHVTKVVNTREMMKTPEGREAAHKEFRSLLN